MKGPHHTRTSSCCSASTWCSVVEEKHSLPWSYKGILFSSCSWHPHFPQENLCVWCKINPGIASIWEYLWNNTTSFIAHHRLYSLSFCSWQGFEGNLMLFWESKKSRKLRLEASKVVEGNPTRSQFHHFGISSQPHWPGAGSVQWKREGARAAMPGFTLRLLRAAATGIKQAGSGMDSQGHPQPPAEPDCPTPSAPWWLHSTCIPGICSGELTNKPS